MSQLVEYLKSIAIFIIVNTLKYKVTANIYDNILSYNYYAIKILSLGYERV